MKRLFGNLFFLFISLSLFAQKDEIINNGKAKIYYKVFGTGKPILIINGGPGLNSNGFEGLARILSQNHRTIIYDQRGTGKSSLEKINDSSISLKLMMDDIEAIRKHLKIKSWVILGHSFGGMLASYYTSIFPANVDGLILSSSGGIDLDMLSYIEQNINARLGPEELKSLDFWSSKLNDGDTSYKTRLNRGMALAPAYLIKKENTALIAERLAEGNSEIRILTWADMRRIKFDCSIALTAFKNPVLIIQGKQDIIEEKTALKAQKVLKKSKVVLMDNCGHYGWLDAPEQYFNEINQFLSRNKL